MKQSKLQFSLLLAMFSTMPAYSADNHMLDTLREKYPATQFTQVNDTQIKGVHEIVMGKNIAYTDDSARYFIFGNVWDMQDRVDLTAARLEQVRRVEWPKAYLVNAIKVVKGNGERQLAVFTDPDCPYCHQLERELTKVDNVTIYYFLYPLESLHPKAKEKAISIWCSTDRAKTWHDWMIDNVEPRLKGCSNAIEDNIRLGEKYGITGTPTLISGDGRMMAGSSPASRIDAWLNVKG